VAQIVNPDDSPRTVIDGLLAVTGRVRGLILVTRNVPGLSRSDVRVLNPFNPADHGE